jgi:hypothetical protein
MSQENVEVVRRFIEALVRAQDSDDWQPVLTELDTDVEIDDLDISLDTEHYRGHDRFRKWIGVWNESWESWRVEDVEVRPVGEDRLPVVAALCVHKRFDKPTNYLDVLLRHRLLRLSSGFEGVFLCCVLAYLHESPVPDGVENCDRQARFDAANDRIPISN